MRKVGRFYKLFFSVRLVLEIRSNTSNDVDTALTSGLLVLSFTVLTGLGAQVVIPLPFTPVPITLQTFFVLLSGSRLGARKGGLSQLLYVLLGLIGVPWFSNGTGGFAKVFAASFGYLIGFVLAGWVVGYLTERYSGDRAVLGFLAGLIVIYGFGLFWLIMSLQLSLSEAFELGLYPFLVGDLMKLVVLLIFSRWFSYREEISRKRLFVVSGLSLALFSSFLLYLYSNGTMVPENLSWVSLGISMVYVLLIVFSQDRPYGTSS